MTPHKEAAKRILFKLINECELPESEITILYR
jgi:hypothetical protein